MQTFPWILLLALAIGCATQHKSAHAGRTYTLRAADVAQASAQPVDTKTARWTVPSDYKAELHLKLNDEGARRFEVFNQTYEGQSFDLLVNGKVLASGLTARPQGPVAEMVWYVGSIGEAKRFATVLNSR